MAKRSTPERKSAEKPAKNAPDEPAVKSEPEKTYVVFARRFRPRSFSDVVGQGPTTGALRQALTSGRLAQAYLFCGPRGVGKTSLARIVAKALNCLNGKGPGGVSEEPCNKCAACESIQEGSSLDVIEMDAATNRGIEEVRSLRDQVGISPAELRYKVYIIDEVHMLTKEAWNAFLKTLEEPPAHVKFIFATTDPNNVPETILSRCQRYDLRRIGPADIVTRLKQICELDKIPFEDAALSRIASLAKGGLRDAEGLLDQAVNLGQGKVTDATVRDLSGAAPDELVSEILKNCAQGNSAAVLLKTHEALEAGADPEDLLSSITERLRGTMLSKVCGVDSALLEGQSHLKEAYGELGALLSEDQILMLLQLFSSARRQMKDASQTRLPLEMALVRAARAKDLVDLGKIVSALESGAGTPARAANPPNSSATTAKEGYRPNSPGRPVVSDNAHPAASSGAPSGSSGLIRTETTSSAAGAGASHGVAQPELWSKVLAAITGQKGGALLASALSHAQSVALDEAKGTLTLGFTADQLFYRDALEKQHNQTLLIDVLRQLGKEVRIEVQRVSGSGSAPALSGLGSPSEIKKNEPVRPRMVRSAPPPSTPPAQARSAAQSAARPMASAQQGDIDEIVCDTDEADVEFDAAGELPLNTALPAGDESDTAGGADVTEEGEVLAAPSRAPVNVPVVRPVTVQRNASDAKAFESNSAVKMLLKEVNGVIVGVTRK
ncbi:MAG TPA: DNA polymerase III subunit gamma/tau [Planctomycetota bacterium]|nr:DNA polymerase III subunit gamma/tau [Planctomycetota bacterium]